MSSADEETSANGEVIAALRDELSRVNALLFTDDTASIIQYIAVVTAGGIVAVLREPAAFIAVPLVANLWLLHMMVKSVTTVKLAAYAKRIETELNARLGVSVYRYQSLLSQRLSGKRPHAFQAFYLYFCLSNAALWVTGIAVLLHRDHVLWAALAVAVCLVSWGSAIATVKQRGPLFTSVTKKLAAGDSTVG